MDCICTDQLNCASSAGYNNFGAIDDLLLRKNRFERKRRESCRLTFVAIGKVGQIDCSVFFFKICFSPEIKVNRNGIKC